MAEVTAGVEELARRALARLLQQPTFLKTTRHRIRRAGHDCEMGETDLAALHGLDALRQLLQVLAHRHRGTCGAAVHVAVVADPVDRGGRALLVVLVGAGKLRSGLREVELQAVDGVAQGDELVTQLLSGCFTPTPHVHEKKYTKHLFGVKR